MADISKEYAEALFILACEDNSEQAYMTALDEVLEVFAQNDDFMLFLSSPNIPLGERVAAIDRVFDGAAPVHVISFIQLLCEKGHIGVFDECVDEFHRLLDLKNSVTYAKVTSAVSLTPSEADALKLKLEKMSGSTVTLDCVVDPALLGGVVVEMNGTVMDGSLRHRLREVKEVMNR